MPKLRFAEFRNNSWKASKLGDVCEFTQGVQIPSSEQIVDQKQGYIRYLYIRDFFSDDFPCYVIDNYPTKIIKEDEIMMVNTGNTAGKAYRGKKGVLSNNSFKIAYDKAVINGNFAFTVLTSDLIQNQIKTFFNSAGQPHLGHKNVALLQFNFPSLPEQQKIASFLSAVDEKIQHLVKKKQLLEQYKKGVRQQLFSGKLRFKDENGKAFPKWEERKLGEVSKIYDGTHQTPNYVSDGIPFYSVEHVTANQFSKTKYISREVFEKENEKVRLEKGDILMTKIGDIGTARLVDWEVEASFYVSLALLKQSKLISAKYLNQYIATRNFQLELWKRIIHVAFPKKINLGEIGNCKVLIPVAEEQQKIASFLTAFDLKIEKVNNQIAQTQNFKKGLLQQMFV